jgi:hypothetical protein
MAAPPSTRPRKPGRALVVWGVLVLVLAALLGLATGLSRLSVKVNDPGRPECNSRLMRPGDRCIRIFGGESESLTYEQMVERLRQNRRKAVRLGNVTTPAAIATAVLAVTLLATGLTRRRRAAPQAPPAPPS